MPGPAPKYAIELTTEEKETLQRLVKARKTSQGQVVRARIIVIADQHRDWTNQQIAQEVGCTDRTVRKWRRQWAERRSLADLPRSGAPRRFSP